MPRSGDRQRRIGLGASAVVVAATLLAGQAPPAGQQPDAPTPRFRAEADVVVVEATVLDRKGVVVGGLGQADFKVEIGGKPRDVVSVDLVEYAPPSTDAATVTADPEITTNEPKDIGRVVLLIIDRGSLGTDTKSVIDSARKWVLSMPPKDLIGLLTFPAPGPTVDFTTDHAKVADALTRVSGVATEMPPFQQYNISIWEAIRMEALDLFVRGDVIGRECRGTQPLCPTEIDMQVKTMLLDAQAQVQPVLRSLRATMRNLAAVPGPKHAVLLSSGWALNERDASTEMGWVAADAARANVTVHTFTAELWALAASRSRPSMRSIEDRNLLMNNVEMLAGMTGGRSVRLSGQADTAFASLNAGLSGYYRLGVQVLPEDLDGKDRRISVKISRPGASLASYRRVMSGARPKVDAPVDGETALRDALKGGPLRTGVDLRATSYVLHATTDTRHLRVVAVGDVNRAAPGRAKAVAALYDFDGRPVTAMENTVDIVADTPGALSVELTAPPGTYVLRVAVLDAEGRIGSLERLVDARWKKTGGVETPGLVLFHSDRAARAAPRPDLRWRHDGRRGDRAGRAHRPGRREEDAGRLRGDEGRQHVAPRPPHRPHRPDDRRHDRGAGDAAGVDAAARTLHAEREDRDRRDPVQDLHGGGVDGIGRGGASDQRRDGVPRLWRTGGSGPNGWPRPCRGAVVRQGTVLGVDGPRASFRRAADRSTGGAARCRAGPRRPRAIEGRTVADGQQHGTAGGVAAGGAVHRRSRPPARRRARGSGAGVPCRAEDRAGLRAVADLPGRLLRRRRQGSGGRRRLADGAGPRAHVTRSAAPGDRSVAARGQAGGGARPAQPGAATLAGRRRLRAPAGAGRAWPTGGWRKVWTSCHSSSSRTRPPCCWRSTRSTTRRGARRRYRTPRETSRRCAGCATPTPRSRATRSPSSMPG